MVNRCMTQAEVLNVEGLYPAFVIFSVDPGSGPGHWIKSLSAPVTLQLFFLVKAKLQYNII